MMTFLEYLENKSQKPLMLESFRGHKGNSPIDLNLDSDQFFDKLEKNSQGKINPQFDTESADWNPYRYYSSNLEEFPTTTGKILVIKPEDGIFKDQTQDLNCTYNSVYHCGTLYRVLDFETADPLYRNKAFAPTLTDLVKILLTCTSEMQFSIDFLSEFRENFKSYYLQNSKERFMAESDIVKPSIQLHMGLPDYSKPLKFMFGKYGAGIATISNHWKGGLNPTGHGVNSTDYSTRYNILKGLVAQNWDFGQPLFILKKSNKASYTENYRFTNIVMSGGIIILIDPDTVKDRPDDLFSHIVDVILYTPFDIIQHYKVVSRHYIPRSVLEVAYSNLVNGYGMSGHKK